MSMTNPAIMQPAYRAGAATLFLAAGALVLALILERWGYPPCPLCLQQRWAYYGAIPFLFIALILYAADLKRAAALLFFAVALAFLANAGLGIYHAGVEWKFWSGPDTCGSGGLTPLSPIGPQGLLKQLESARVIRCDEPALRVFGLSLAGWNVLASFLAFVMSLKAAFATTER